MHEAKIDETPAGRLPADDGWFILNLDEIAWRTIPGNGTWCVFESPAAPSTMLGIGVHVLAPGEPSCKYHHEPDQEGFLVIAGECLAGTADPKEAYAGGPPSEPAPSPWPFR